MSKANAKIISNISGILLLPVAINAFGGRYYGMAGAEGVPAEWLEGSPFTSYFIPSLIVFAYIGGWGSLHCNRNIPEKPNLHLQRLLFPE